MFIYHRDLRNVCSVDSQDRQEIHTATDMLDFLWRTTMFREEKNSDRDLYWLSSKFSFIVFTGAR